MPYVDPEFTVPTIPEDERYEGTELDDNVRKSTDRPDEALRRLSADHCLVLPPNCKILWVATYGASFWAISTKIDVELEDARKQSYFMKVSAITI
jgi:protein-ribulosamine 3-kinase